MTRDSGGRIPHEQTALRRRKTARRISMTIGLMIAAFVAAAMVARLFSPPSSSGRQIASHKAHKVITSSQKVIALHQQAEFAVPGVPAPPQIDPVLLDPNGEIVVTVTGNGQISAWSTSSGRPLSTFSTLPDGVPASSQDLSSPMFSADGQEFSVLEGGESSPEVADVWNVNTGRATEVPIPSGSSTNSAQAATPGPNGLVAVEYANDTLRLTPPTGRPNALAVIHARPDTAPELGGPIFSPDGSAIAVSDGLGLIHLVSVPGWRLAGVLTAEKIYNNESILNVAFSKEIDSVTFSPDSKRVACGTESGIVRVWDVATGRSVSAFSVSSSASGTADARSVKTLVFSPDGKTLVTADDADSTLAVWDVASGRQVATLNAGTGNVAAAAFTADGKLVVATTSSSASSQGIEVWATSAGLGG